MNVTEPAHRFKWYHAVIVAVGVIVLLCAGMFAVLNSSPQVKEAIQSAGTTLSELNAVRQKVAAKYSVSVGNVGVEVNSRSLSSGKNSRNTTLSLVTSLVNTSFSELPKSDQSVKMKEIASFIKASYSQSAAIDHFCVTLVQQSQVLFFTSGQNNTACYENSDLR